MGLLNLALGQLFGLFLPLAGLLVALYFYDRSRRRVLVSTLRFWPDRPAPAVRQRHRRIQHPLSLLLQLVALLLLLLAIADPRPEGAGAVPKQHVVLMDTSAATALDGDGGRLIDEVKALAAAYLDSVAGTDPVLLIEADGAPSVRVPFTTDRRRLREAVGLAEPGWTALDLQAAFDLAGGALRLALDADGEQLGERSARSEVVYIGPGLFEGPPVRASEFLRVRFLQTGEAGDTLGLLAFRAVADGAEPGKWEVELVARNYGDRDSRFRVDFYFDERPLGHRQIAVESGSESALEFTLRTKGPGRLVARAAETDAFEANNEAALDIPAVRRTRLQVVGGSREAFEPLLASGAYVEPSFVASRNELVDDAIHVWARGGEAGDSRRAIYIAPPGTATPFADAGSTSGMPIAEWSASHPLARGVRDPDLVPSRARVFERGEGDDFVAGTAEGPVVMARSTGERKLVAFGFDIAEESVRGRLAAPLLFANAVSWLDAGAFRSESVEARAPGAVEVDAPNSSREQIAVRVDDGAPVPWVLAGESVRFYAGRPGRYRVTTADREVTLFLNQPRIGATAWDPPESVARGLPAANRVAGEPLLLWPWLAALAAAILLYDWIRFGRGRRPTTGAFAASGAVTGEGSP